MRFIVIGGGCYGVYHSGQLYKAIQKGKLPAESQLIVVDRNARPRIVEEYGDKAEFKFVQSEWQDFLLNFFGDPARFNPETDGEEVQLVPAPFAPHLFFDWLKGATEARLKQLGREDIALAREGFDFTLHLPYEYADTKNLNHFMSRAGWTCPATCIEPHLCPAVKGVRDWDLAEDVGGFVAGRPVKPSVSAAEKLSEANLSNGVAVLEAPTVAPDYFAGAEVSTVHHFVYGIGTTPARVWYEAYTRMVELALSLSQARPEARVAVGTVSRCHGVVATLRLNLNPGNKFPV